MQRPACKIRLSTNRPTWTAILTGKEEIRTTTSTFFKRGSISQRPAQRIETHGSYKPRTAGHRLLERKRTRKLAQRKNKNASFVNKEDILKRRIVNLSSRTLTKSETNLLHKGLNVCPTPPPPRKEKINDDIDAFARRLNLKEYGTRWMIWKILSTDQHGNIDQRH